MTTDIDQLLQRYGGPPSREEAMHGEGADARTLAVEVRILRSRLKEAEGERDEYKARWKSQKNKRRVAKRAAAAQHPRIVQLEAVLEQYADAVMEHIQKQHDGHGKDAGLWQAEYARHALSTPPNQEEI